MTGHRSQSAPLWPTPLSLEETARADAHTFDAAPLAVASACDQEEGEGGAPPSEAPVLSLAPDLLARVFASLDCRSLAAAAAVCRPWKFTASADADAIWARLIRLEVGCVDMGNGYRVG